MVEDVSFRTFIIGILTSIPAILLALAAFAKSIKGEAKIESLTKQGNGERDALIRSLVQDAWNEGHRAGTREQQALHATPPKNPDRPG